MNSRKLLQKALSSPANLRFAEVCALARAFGFHLSRVSGSHHIFAHQGVRELVNLQDVGGKAKDYHMNVFFSDEDGGYIADIPDLPHCAAFGETPEQALAEVLKAKAAWIEAAKAEGKPVPPPTFRPVIYQVS